MRSWATKTAHYFQDYQVRAMTSPFKSENQVSTENEFGQEGHSTCLSSSLQILNNVQVTNGALISLHDQDRRDYLTTQDNMR